MTALLVATLVVLGITAFASYRALTRLRAERDTAAKRADEAERALATSTAELRRYASELERSNADLEQFAYVASHDLSEPLRTVSSFVRLLQQRYGGQLDATADEFIGYAVDGSARMQRLIDDLLSYSRVGRAEILRDPVDLDELLQDTVAGLRAAMEACDATLESDPLPIVAGDRRQLGQVLQNLLANAIKFTPPGESPQVEVRAKRAGACWEVRVIDHGIGIDPGSAGRIFKMFQRLHGRDSYEGTGIGLAIVQRIVERHGGRVWFEPTEGGGSTFALTLQAAPSSATAGVAGPAEALGAAAAT